jgi:segregation and condensation protein B
MEDQRVMCTLSGRAALLESLLFTSENPLTIDALVQYFPEHSMEDWKIALEELKAHYEGYGHAICLEEVAGGYQLRTRREFAPWIARIRSSLPQRLSRAALETLAVVVYKQPIIRSEIEAVRGVDVGGVLRQLLDRGLIQILGRRDIPGRPMLYGTTTRFLEVFGLKDLASLPTQEELAALVEPELSGFQE